MEIPFGTAVGDEGGLLVEESFVPSFLIDEFALGLNGHRFAPRLVGHCFVLPYTWYVLLLSFNSCTMQNSECPSQWPASWSLWNPQRQTDSHLQLWYRLQPGGKQYSHMSSWRSVVWEWTYMSRCVVVELPRVHKGTSSHANYWRDISCRLHTFAMSSIKAWAFTYLTPGTAGTIML